MGIGILAKAWPAGTTVAALIAAGTWAYFSWISTRIEKYCAAPGMTGAIVVKYWHLKFPDKIAQNADVWIGSNLGFNTDALEKFKVMIPRDCDPWVAWRSK
ncbi:MAG TPA: hypothetical protein VGK74_25285 [Symbiobacteriaceae bacterium]